jgi:PAS domain S-box-containing protein
VVVSVDPSDVPSEVARKAFIAQSIILDSIDQGVIVCEAGGHIIFANTAAARLFGYASVDEFTAVPFHATTQRLAFFDADGARVQLEQLLEPALSGTADNSSPLIKFRLRVDSAERWYRLHVRPIPEEPGEKPLTVAVWEDVTERRRASDPTRLLAAIVATSEDAIISKTLDGTVTSWNRAAAQLYGWSADEIIGQSITRIVPPDKREELADILARLAQGERIEQHETVRVTRDGRRLDISVSISPILDNDGRVVGAAKIARDITRRREAERFADEFLAGLAHDVNNPLATARLQTQLLQRRLSRGELDPEKTKDSLTAIEASITKMSRRINELSDFSRLRLNGELELKLSSMDLNEVIERVARSCPQPDRIQVRPAATALVGYWDAERLERVFDNLLTNALKYSGNETDVIIELSREQRDNGEIAVVTVIDSGVGILEADLPYIFDRFRRGSNVVGRFAGSGIGLAGARQIVQLHDGTIAIESKAGSGTSVTVHLPLKSASPDSGEA